jgi:hypothetical protein
MVSVGIVGAGLSGLCMAIKLQKAGFHNFTIYEAADDIGGTVSPCSCMTNSIQVYDTSAALAPVLTRCMHADGICPGLSRMCIACRMSNVLWVHPLCHMLIVFTLHVPSPSSAVARQPLPRLCMRRPECDVQLLL